MERKKDKLMKKNGNFFGNYGLLIGGIFCILVQVFLYIASWDALMSNSIGFFIANSVCGIFGILCILGYIFVIKEK